MFIYKQAYRLTSIQLYKILQGRAKKPKSILPKIIVRITTKKKKSHRTQNRNLNIILIYRFASRYILLLLRILYRYSCSQELFFPGPLLGILDV